MRCQDGRVTHGVARVATKPLLSQSTTAPAPAPAPSTAIAIPDQPFLHTRFRFHHIPLPAPPSPPCPRCPLPVFPQLRIQHVPPPLPTAAFCCSFGGPAHTHAPPLAPTLSAL